jgi:hypothetical protein
MPDGAADAAAAKKSAKEKTEAGKQKKRDRTSLTESARTERLRYTSASATSSSEPAASELPKVTPAMVDKAWAEWAFAAPVPMSALQTALFKQAAKLTSQLHQSDEAQKKPNAPFYQPPSRHNLDGPLLQQIKEDTTADMQAVQSTEAMKYGLSGTSDGRGSNPQSRPVEGMLFETPTMAAMVNAEDLSGMVKSAPNVAAKIILWGDEKLAAMGLPQEDTEVMTGFRAVIARLYHGNSAKSMKALAQFMVYKNRTKGVFGETAVFAQASVMPAHEWWELYGSEVPELQYVAMKVLSKRSSACSVERLWSFFGQVWNDSRASLGAKKARDLVLAGSNIRLKNQLLGMELESDMRSHADPDMSDDEE